MGNGQRVAPAAPESRVWEGSAAHRGARCFCGDTREVWGGKKPPEAFFFLLLPLSAPGADASQCPEEITLPVPSAAETKSRISSTSSVSTDPNSLDTSEEGAETPVVQSDEEDLQEDSPKEQAARS